MVNQDLFYLNFNMLHYFKIVRPLNLLIITSCIILAASILDRLTTPSTWVTVTSISKHSWSEHPIDQIIIIISLIITIVLLAAFANVFNDIIDYKIDIINRPDRPIPSNMITIRGAIIYAILLFILALIVILYNPFIIPIHKFNYYVILALIIIYTLFLKRMPLVGNITVAFLSAMVFFIPALSLKPFIGYTPMVIPTVPEFNITDIIPVTTFSFLLMLIREIVKDIADIEGDQQYNAHTFPIKFGIIHSFTLIVILSLILSIISFYFFYIELYNLPSILLITIFILCPLLYYLNEFRKNKTSTYCIYLSKVLKLLTICGVIVIYLTTLFR